MVNRRQLKKYFNNMLNYDSLTSKISSSSKATSPREIYLSLPNKSDKFSPYPRDVQGVVWEGWFKRRTEKDLVIKMNTGGGKTTVGLLILQSSLKEGVSPAVYVAPNIFLAEQVKDEAAQLGIAVTTDPFDSKFQSGKSILVTYIHKLVNGLSVFGVSGGSRQVIELGTIVFDDAHASIETIEKQFSISIPNEVGSAYKEVYDLVSSSLEQQNCTTAAEISDGAPHRAMLIPYWTWQDNYPKIARILTNYRERDDMKFSWPLIKNSLKCSHGVVSSEQIEISPHCIPIATIPSISNAKRKVYMTATLADDGALSTHFGVAEDTIRKPIVPASPGDVGDRIILSPQLVDPSLSDEECMELAKTLSHNVNVVAIVPSEIRSLRWQDYADEILIGDAVQKGIDKLRKKHVGLVVLVNRYDGIDLPDNACRILFLDGYPDVRRLIDIIKQGYLAGSAKVAAQIAQRIEQGAGRGIRSIQDYCAVILMGKALCNQVYSKGVRERFSPATAAQLDLSELVSEEVKNLSDIENLLTTEFLNRSSRWPALSKNAVSDLTYNPTEPDRLYAGLREAFDSAQINDYHTAVSKLRKTSDSIDEQITKGLAKQYLAEYTNLSDVSEAQKAQLNAVKLNTSLLKPLEGINFKRPASAATNQSKAILEYVREHHKEGNRYLIAFNEVIEDLKEGIKNVPRFEEAMKETAFFLGMVGSRPESEYNRGPDVLWSMKNQQYLVIECKTGATNGRICKGDCNQLNGSGTWFSDEFDDSCTCSLLIIHPNNKIEYSASLPADTRIMTTEKITEFKQALHKLAKAISSKFRTIQVEDVEQLIHSLNLQSNKVFETYSVPFKHLKRKPSK